MAQTFGLRYESGKFMSGDKVIKIQGDNIETERCTWVPLVCGRYH